jgi:hypothetical protein
MKRKIFTVADKIIRHLKDRGLISLFCTKNDQHKRFVYWYPSRYSSAPYGVGRGEDDYIFISLNTKRAKDLIINHLLTQNILIVSIPPLEYFFGNEKCRMEGNYKFKLSYDHLYLYNNDTIFDMYELGQDCLNDEGFYRRDCVTDMLDKIRNSNYFTKSLGIELACFLNENKFDFDFTILVNEIEFEEIAFEITSYKFSLSKKYNTSNAEKKSLLIDKFGYIKEYDFNSDIIITMKCLAEIRTKHIQVTKGTFFYTPINEVVPHYEN